MHNKARVINRVEEDPVMSKFLNRFSFPNKPSGALPELPQYLDDLSDEDMMALYTEFIAWVSFAKSDLVQAEIAEDKESSNCRLIEAKVLIEQWGTEVKGDRVTIAKARRDTDSRVVDQQFAYQQARAYRKLVESVFDRCERGAQLLSRELSRRISSHPRDNRAARYTT
jgi:hypothetical protein